MDLNLFILLILLSICKVALVVINSTEVSIPGAKNFNDDYNIWENYGNLGFRRQKMDWLELILQRDPDLTYSVQEHPKRCTGLNCQTRCNVKNCKTKCEGVYCDAACFAPRCHARCTGASCRAMCIGDSCTSECEGKFCDIGCRGRSCKTECENDDVKSCFRRENGRVKNRIKTSPRTTTPTGMTTQTASGYSYTIEESQESYHIGQYGGELQTWMPRWPWPPHVVMPEPKWRRDDASEDTDDSSSEMEPESSEEEYDD